MTGSTSSTSSSLQVAAVEAWAYVVDPGVMCATARRFLKPGGLMVSFTPNGNPEDASASGWAAYNAYCGRLHPPLLITSAHLEAMGEQHGFRVCTYGLPDRCSAHVSPAEASAAEGLVTQPSSVRTGAELLGVAVKDH